MILCLYVYMHHIIIYLIISDHIIYFILHNELRVWTCSNSCFKHNGLVQNHDLDIVDVSKIMFHIFWTCSKSCLDMLTIMCLTFRVGSKSCVWHVERVRNHVFDRLDVIEIMLFCLFGRVQNRVSNKS